MNMTKLRLKKFDPASLKTDSVIVAVARRRSGKSYLIKDLLSHHNDAFAAATVICPTEEFNRFYSEFVPPAFIHHEYDSQILERIIKRQKDLNKRIEADKMAKGYSNVDMSLLVIMDDVMSDVKWTNDPSIRFLFLNGRHLKVCFIVLSQYCKNLPPSLRSNVDYSFLLKEPSFENKKKLYESFSAAFPNFEVFSQVLDQLTEDYGVMVLDNTGHSARIEETVFWYRANVDIPPFTIGDRRFWEKNNRCYRDADSDDEYEPSPSSGRRKKCVRVRLED